MRGSFQQRKTARSDFDASFQDFAEISRENEALNEEYVKAVDTGSGDLAAIRERLDAVSQRYQTASANARRSRDDIDDTGLAIQSAFERRSNVVAEAKAASGHPDGAVRSNAQNKAAADRLADAGLDQLALKNARRSFAASITDFPLLNWPGGCCFAP